MIFIFFKKNDPHNWTCHDRLTPDSYGLHFAVRMYDRRWGRCPRHRRRPEPPWTVTLWPLATHQARLTTDCSRGLVLSSPGDTSKLIWSALSTQAKHPYNSTVQAFKKKTLSYMFSVKEALLPCMGRDFVLNSQEWSPTWCASHVRVPNPPDYMDEYTITISIPIWITLRFHLFTRD